MHSVFIGLQSLSIPVVAPADLVLPVGTDEARRSLVATDRPTECATVAEDGRHPTLVIAGDSTPTNDCAAQSSQNTAAAAAIAVAAASVAAAAAHAAAAAAASVGRGRRVRTVTTAGICCGSGQYAVESSQGALHRHTVVSSV